MQKGLLLIFELKRDQETRSFDQVVSIILCCTLDDLLVIFQFVGLQYVASNIIFE